MNKCVNAFRFRGSPLLIHSTVAPGQARRRRVWGHTVEDRPPTVWPSIPQTLTEPLIRIQHYSKHHILHNQLSLLLWNSDSCRGQKLSTETHNTVLVVIVEKKGRNRSSGVTRGGRGILGYWSGKVSLWK